MPKPLKLYVTVLVAVSAVALTASYVLYGFKNEIALQLDGDPGTSQLELAAGLGFWIVLSILTSALPVRMPRGILVAVAIAPTIAAINLGGPAAGGLVALIGTTELRELRGRIPWYGTLANHAGIVLPAVACGVVIAAFQNLRHDAGADFIATILGASIYFFLNITLASGLVAVRTGIPFRELALSDLGGFAVSLAALAPLGWLMARVYQQPGAGWWMTLLFGLPLFTTRVAYQRWAEMREMFTQTIGALAEAVDKRDPYTSKHSQRVRLISVDIGRELHVSAAQLEALEWGGLLHDVGKIGVPDSVLLKQGKLTRDERITMNAHPVLGAEIIGPVNRLAAELPVIRHHHEWYNGSGYPDRLMGDEIPHLARILHVADAFEAMTADRPYRKALSQEQALAELRKFAGVQFDPEVVDAFVKTTWAENAREREDPGELRPIPLLSQHGARAANALDAPAPGSPAADLA
jgi:HD-GYP domain-containing protein (c-di-GMP phosphodiesterase class II)